MTQPMNDKPVPASIECQSEIDKDLVRAYYGDIEAFYRVRAALAATPAVGGEREALIDRLRTLQDHYSVSGQLGHENRHIFAEAADAVAAPPAFPLRGREAVIEECARVADALTKKWGQPNGEDYNQGMNDHGIRIASNIRALASASPPEQPAADSALNLWAAIRQRDANINAFFAALKVEEDQMHTIEGLRMGSRSRGIEDHKHEIELEPLYTAPPASPLRGTALEPFAKELERQEKVRSYRDGDCYLADCRLTIGDLRRLVAASPPGTARSLPAA